jgi:plastocyanin
MHIHKLFAVLVLVATLTLQACGDTPSSATDTPDPTAEEEAATTPTEDANETDEPSPTVVPTPTITPTPAPTEAAQEEAQPGGTLAWRDQILYSDAVVVSASDLSEPPAGEVYAAWLANDEGRLALGPLRLTGEGEASLSYTSPEQRNLLGSYDQVYITQVPQAEATSTFANAVLQGRLPPQALEHIRAILSNSEATPEQIGFALGMRQQTNELLRHSQFLRDSINDNDLPLAQWHAEHLINIIRGSEARDVNGDGAADNPGDGFGLLPNGVQAGYVQGTIDQAQRVARASDATEEIQIHAGHVEISSENTYERIEEIRRLAERIAAAASAEEAERDMLAILALAQQAIQGVDANLDEQVAPIPGEGGVMTAYQHAQLMAAVPLEPAEETSTVAETDIETEDPAADQEFTIEIGDNTFSPNKPTVPLGATVIWTQNGQRPHTVTADDGSFDSGTLESGDTFSVTFDEPGTFAYHCDFHGAPGGEGMTGTIIVADVAQDAEEPAATEPAAEEPAATEPAAEEPAATEPAAKTTVTINDNRFTEREMTVPAGTTVVWSHESQRLHTVTADDGLFDSGQLINGETFRFTFDEPGTYPYYCEFHGGPEGQGMSGVIIVQ